MGSARHAPALEHDFGVRPSCGRDLADGAPGRGGERRAHVGDPCRFVLAAAVRNRREVRRVGFDEHAVDRREHRRGAHVLCVLERHDAAEREVRAERQRAPRFLGSAGEAVEDGAIGNALVVEHAEGVVPRVTGVDHERAAEPMAPARSARGTPSPARRRRSAGSRSRSRSPRRRRPPACSPARRAAVPLGVELRRVVRVQPDGGGHVGVARRRPRSTPADEARSVPTQTTPSTPAARARSSAASAPPLSDGRWQWLSTQVTSRCGERAGRPCRGSSPPAAAPTRRHPAAARRRGCRAGRAVATAPPTRVGSAATRAARPTRNASRQSPSTAAAAPLSPALFSAHGCLSSMYEFASRMRSHTAPKPFE